MHLYWHGPSERTQLSNASDNLSDTGGLGFPGHSVVCDDIEGAQYVGVPCFCLRYSRNSLYGLNDSVNLQSRSSEHCADALNELSLAVIGSEVAFSTVGGNRLSGSRWPT
jgi:hypothetical protein